MRNRKVFLLLALLAASLACTMHLGGPEYPETVIPTSPDIAAQMQAQLKEAVEAGVNGGDVILTINESQLTSFLSLALEKENAPFLSEPKVFLRDGKMQVYGKATQGNFTATVKLVLIVGIDVLGQSDISIESADFGPLPVPEGLATAISAIIKEAYMGAVGPVVTGFRIEKIGIRDGFLVMLGRVK